jgi:hypothetical protein
MDKEDLLRCLLRPDFDSATRVFAAVESSSNAAVTLDQLAKATGLRLDRVQRQLAALRRTGLVQVTRRQYGLTVQTSVPVGTPPLPATAPMAAPAVNRDSAPLPVAPALAAPSPLSVKDAVAAEIARQRALRPSVSPTSAPSPSSTGAELPGGDGVLAPSPLPGELSFVGQLEPELVRLVTVMQHELDRVELTRHKVAPDKLRALAIAFRAQADLQAVTSAFVDWLTSNKKSAAAKRKAIAAKPDKFDWDEAFDNHVRYSVRIAHGEPRRRKGASAPAAAPMSPGSAPAAANADTIPAAEQDAAWNALTPDQRDALVQIKRDEMLGVFGPASPKLATLDYRAMARHEAALSARRRASAAPSTTAP